MNDDNKSIFYNGKYYQSWKLFIVDGVNYISLTDPENSSIKLLVRMDIEFLIQM